MRKGKDPEADPDLYLSLMDPDPGRPKNMRIRIPNTPDIYIFFRKSRNCNGEGTTAQVSFVLNVPPNASILFQINLQFRNAILGLDSALWRIIAETNQQFCVEVNRIKRH